MSPRTQARRYAVAIHYAALLTGKDATSTKKGLLRDKNWKQEMVEEIGQGPWDSKLLDDLLSAKLVSLPLTRRPMDLETIIISMGIHEMRNLPKRVAVNEALELAKFYGVDTPMVNKVLDEWVI